MTSYSGRVVTYFAGSPNPSLLLIGEAPGPRGANRTGFPFWGDDSGLEVYRLVEELGLFDEQFTQWKAGEDLSGTRPPCGRYAITNACSQMPIDDRGRFCEPEQSRLETEAPRLLSEIRALKPKVVLACGRSAAYTLARATLVDGSNPPSVLSRTFTRIKLGEAMGAVIAQSHTTPWKVFGALALITVHPSCRRWAQRAFGKMHTKVVERMRQAIGSESQAG